MAKKPQHRRHSVDRVLKCGRHLDVPGPQRRHRASRAGRARPKLHRRAARQVPAVRQYLRRDLALEHAQYAVDPRFRPAERDHPADQPLERTQSPGPVQLPRRGPRQVPELRGKARQHRPPERAVVVAVGDLVEMHEPRIEPRRQHIRAPRQRMPSRVISQPRTDQRPRRIARARADSHQIVDQQTHARPQSSRSGAGRKPYRGRVAHQFAGQLDIAVEDGRTALGVARPALADPGLGVRRDAADQRVSVKRPGRRRAARRGASGQEIEGFGPRRRHPRGGYCPRVGAGPFSCAHYRGGGLA